jgi:hypothetical protein
MTTDRMALAGLVEKGSDVDSGVRSATSRMIPRHAATGVIASATPTTKPSKECAMRFSFKSETGQRPAETRR